MFMESSDPHHFGDKARLRSVSFNSTSSSVCLSFWYHMNGAHMGTLYVHVNREGQTFTAWARSGQCIVFISSEHYLYW